jgi:hypothetical protein
VGPRQGLHITSPPSTHKRFLPVLISRERFPTKKRAGVPSRGRMGVKLVSICERCGSRSFRRVYPMGCAALSPALPLPHYGLTGPSHTARLSTKCPPLFAFKHLTGDPSSLSRVASLAPALSLPLSCAPSLDLSLSRSPSFLTISFLVSPLLQFCVDADERRQHQGRRGR